MDSPIWQIVNVCARLEIARSQAVLDLERPEFGLHDVHLSDGPHSDCRLLGVELSQGETDDHAQLVEAYCRGNDLIASYRLPRRDSLRVQLYWRFLSAETASTGLSIELLVSVQTSELHSPAGMFTTTRMPVDEVLRLADAPSGRWQRLASTDARRTTLDPADGPGCVVVRLPNAPVSYVEMIHPADFLMMRLGVLDADQGLCRLRQDLFSEPLEKGVIVKARVRGLFVSRDGDLDSGLASYGDFIKEEPPLTS